MRNQPDSVMLFAAGFGTRMGALTAQTPKPLVKVAGKPLIDHALEQVRGIDTRRIVVNLHYRAEQIKDHLADQDVLFSHEEPEILETGGGLSHALPLLGNGPVFTMNTDSAWSGPNPLAQLAATWDPDRMDALLLCLPRDRAIGHSGTGDFQISDEGRLTRGPGVVYSGLQILKTDGLVDIPDHAFSLNRLWDRMLRDQRLCGVVYDGYWCDVGTPQGVQLAEAMLRDADV